EGSLAVILRARALGGTPMRYSKVHLVGCFLVLGAVSAARAQDFSEKAFEESEDRIVLSVKGHAEAIASSVVLEFVIRGEGESAIEAEHAYARKMTKLLKGMPEASPVTTAIAIELSADRKVTIHGFVCKHAQNGNFTQESGTTVSGRFQVAVRGLDQAPPRLA